MVRALSVRAIRFLGLGQFLFLVVVGILVGVLVVCVAPAQEPAGITTKQVMKEAHKKPKELLRKVVQGQATQSDKERLLELYRALAKNDPPKGSRESWNEKTKLLVESAEAALAGKPDALRDLERAANCKACHEAHKK